MASQNDLFGGFSALVDWKDDSLLAVSDNGRRMVFAKPDRSDEPPWLGVFPETGRFDKRDRDYEALTWNPETGEVWVAAERSNSIWRFATPLAFLGKRSPPQMAEWKANTGAESLVRLANGSFVAISEGREGDRLHPAVLFDRDPSQDGPAESFYLEGREGYRPSDATLLPDGRLLIVLRKVEYSWPPKFRVMLVTADPALIKPGKKLATKVLGSIEPPLPSENYEGVTATVEADGRTVIWLISDDNFTRYQRTILLKFVVDGPLDRERQKARE